MGKSSRWILVAVIVLALAWLACSFTSQKATPTRAPTVGPTQQPTKPQPTVAPTKKPTATKPVAPPASGAQFTNLVFASQVISDSEGFVPVDAGVSFFDISEISAVWDYEGAYDGAAFRRVWTLDGEVVLDRTSPWDGGDEGTYHLSLFVDSGTLDPGNYTLELYFDGKLLASGEFEITAESLPVGKVVYQDDFADDASGWDISEGDDVDKGYEAGQYFITVKETDWLAWATPEPELDLADIVIEVDATFESGPSDNKVEFGPVCRYLDADNFYYFLVRADGYVGIVKMDGDDQIVISSANDKLESSTAVKRGPNVTHHIKAVCVGDSFELYVNGKLVAQAQDSALASGNVGLIVGTYSSGGPARVVFDDFTITEPQ